MLNNPDTNIKKSLSEQNRVEEEVRTAYLRSGGNLLSTIKELKHIPREYIAKIIDKFKKESKIKVTNIVGERILEHILFGYSSRTTILFDNLKKIESQEKQTRSICHNARARQLRLEGQSFDSYECGECNEICEVYDFYDEDSLALKNDILDKLRKEDESVANLVIKLGYSDKEPLTSTPIIRNQQNFVVMPGAKVDDALIQDMAKLNPIEQESLRLELQKQISEAEIEE